MSVYNDEYQLRMAQYAERSAEAVVPIVLDLVAPRSVVDVGCGLGIWLRVFGQHGVKDLMGIDGNHIRQELLHIPRESFIAADLEHPYRTDRTFDLVVALEVAEHLPPEASESFVETLTQLGPTVLFSAAIPYQIGGNHVNEQWPSYWARLFEERGYIAFDCLRPQIWQNDRVEWWYRQNMVLYVRRDQLSLLAELHAKVGPSVDTLLSLVHPDCYLVYAGSTDRILESFLMRFARRLIPRPVRVAIRRRMLGQEMLAQGEDALR